MTWEPAYMRMLGDYPRPYEQEEIVTANRPYCCELCDRTFQKKVTFDIGCGYCRAGMAIALDAKAEMETINTPEGGGI